jgi:LysR family nitrogen assimilation transcriptional regulator
VEMKQLEAFIHVAELGSFSRAASILDTTQPALSRLVRQLESELRHNLLHRTGRGVVVTEAGQILLAHAKGIALQAERARHDLAELRGATTGHFTVGLAPSIARVTTVALVRGFKAQFPDATIAVVEGLSTHLSEWLQMGRIDAAVLYDIGLTALIDKHILFEEELFLVGSPRRGKRYGASVAFREIGKFPLVIPSRLHAVRHSVETHAAELGVKLNIAMEIDAVSSILDLVFENYGFAVLPSNAVASDPAKRKFSVSKLTDPTPMTSLALATSARHPLSRLANDAIALYESQILPIYVQTRA